MSTNAEEPLTARYLLEPTIWDSRGKFSRKVEKIHKTVKNQKFVYSEQSLWAKNLVVATYLVKLFKTVHFIETKNAYFEKTKKNQKYGSNIQPHFFEGSRQRVQVKKFKKASREVRMHREG